MICSPGRTEQLANGIRGGVYREKEAASRERIYMEPQQLAMKVEYGMKVTHVEFIDEKILDEERIAKIRESLEPVIEKNQDGQLLLNFVNVQFMTSAMLGLLVRVHKKVSERSGELRLCNVAPGIRKVFEITKLTKVFDIS